MKNKPGKENIYVYRLLNPLPSMISAAFLILTALWLRWLSYYSFQQTQGSYYYGNSNSDILQRLVVTGIYILFFAAVSLILPRILSTRKMIRLSLPFYLFVILICLVSVVTNYYNKQWLYIGTSVYVPALLALIIFAVSYLVCRYQSIGGLYAAVVAAAVIALPFLISVIGMRCLSVGLELLITFMILSFRLSKDRRLPQSWKKILIFFLFILAVSFILLILYRTSFSRRLMTALSGGLNDPYGIGFDYIEMRKGLKESRFIGMSSYAIDGTQPVYRHFATADNSYAPAVIVLCLGWAALIAVLAAVFILIRSLYRMAGIAGNSFARYFTYLTASYFTVRTILGLFSCFVIILSNANLPFQGPTSSTLVDIILLGFSLGLCRKTDAPDLIDRDDTTGSLLHNLEETLKEELHRKIRSLTGLDLDDDDFDDFLFYDEDDDSRYSGHIISFEEKNELRTLRRQILELQSDYNALQSENLSLLQIQQKYAAALAENARNTTGRGPGRSWVFLSYNHKDKRYMKMLSRALEEKGITTWYYERDIRSEDYPKRILEALRRTRVFVVLITRSSNESEHIFNEVALAFEMIRDGLTIMPVIIEDVELSDNLHYYLCRQEQTDASLPPIERQIRRFADKVEAVMQEP